MQSNDDASSALAERISLFDEILLILMLGKLLTVTKKVADNFSVMNVNYTFQFRKCALNLKY